MAKDTNGHGSRFEGAVAVLKNHCGILRTALAIRSGIPARALHLEGLRCIGDEKIMNKLELISTLREKEDLSKPEASTVVDLFVDNMADALARGDRVEIRGLCSFSVKKYKSYIGRNPKTGDKVTIKTKKLPFFKAGKELKLRVNR